MRPLLCTCGDPVGQRNHYDVTEYCNRGEHEICTRFGSTLSGATGYHWWCACDCHPEPEMSRHHLVAGIDRAHRTWERARALQNSVSHR